MLWINLKCFFIFIIILKLGDDVGVTSRNELFALDEWFKYHNIMSRRIDCFTFSCFAAIWNNKKIFLLEQTTIDPIVQYYRTRLNISVISAKKKKDSDRMNVGSSH